jgi:hypothetical protein
LRDVEQKESGKGAGDLIEDEKIEDKLEELGVFKELETKFAVTSSAKSASRGGMSSGAPGVAGVKNSAGGIGSNEEGKGGDGGVVKEKTVIEGKRAQNLSMFHLFLSL